MNVLHASGITSPPSATIGDTSGAGGASTPRLLADTRGRGDDMMDRTIDQRAVYRVDLYRHSEYDAFATHGPCKFFRTLREAKSWARREVFHGEWHHAHIDRGAWSQHPEDGDWTFDRDDDYFGHEVYDPYVEVGEHD